MSGIWPAVTPPPNSNERLMTSTRRLRAAKRMPAGDRRAVALAAAVEHPHRHDLRAEREPGHADAVVDALGDRRRDVRPVAVVVVRVAVVGDEVVAAREAVAAQVGRAGEAPAVGVRDAGVEHRDRRRRVAAGPAGLADVVPRGGGVDAERPGEVPLDLLPAAGRRARGRGRWGCSSRARCSSGVALSTPGAAAQRAARCATLSPRRVFTTRVRGATASPTRRWPPRVRRVADDHLAGDVVGRPAAGAREASPRAARRSGAAEHAGDAAVGSRPAPVEHSRHAEVAGQP